MKTYSNKEKYLAAARETALRKKVYPRWIQSGKMSEREAAHELAVMAEIAADYKQKSDKEEPDLFGGMD